MMMKRSSETVSVGLVTLAERTFEKRRDLALRSHLQRVMVAEYIDVVTLGHGRFEKLAIDSHRFRAWILGYETFPHGGKRVMRSDHFKRFVRLGTEALMVLMAHGLCAPASAWASCGHSVNSPSALISSLYNFDELIMTGTLSVSEDGLAQTSRNRSLPGHGVPCSGLSCSGRVPLPVPTASLVHERSDQWGTLGAPVVLDNSSRPAKTKNGPLPHSGRQSSYIFHPPRV
jgi:hypothetical protein